MLLMVNVAGFANHVFDPQYKIKLLSSYVTDRIVGNFSLGYLCLPC